MIGGSRTKKNVVGEKASSCCHPPGDMSFRTRPILAPMSTTATDSGRNRKSSWIRKCIDRMHTAITVRTKKIVIEDRTCKAGD